MLHIYLYHTSWTFGLYFGLEIPQSLKTLLICSLQLCKCHTSSFPHHMVIKLDVVLLLQLVIQYLSSHCWFFSQNV
uniref:Uncharacterized protein n=1 Tax=Arundo donax TaxID=35708 RepID=A0A0A9D2X1_ARUDO